MFGKTFLPSWFDGKLACIIVLNVVTASSQPCLYTLNRIWSSRSQSLCNEFPVQKWLFQLRTASTSPEEVGHYVITMYHVINCIPEPAFPALLVVACGLFRDQAGIRLGTGWEQLLCIIIDQSVSFLWPTLWYFVHMTLSNLLWTKSIHRWLHSQILSNLAVVTPLPFLPVWVSCSMLRLADGLYRNNYIVIMGTKTCGNQWLK